MKPILFSSKRVLSALTCVSLISLMTACGPENGYYDSNGRYVQSNASRDPYPSLGGRNTDYDDHYDQGDQGDRYTDRSYGHRGYDDRDERYITLDNGLNIPARMYPTRGMCRVWFIDRSLADQPAIQDCRYIERHVPRNAYVIYGR